MRTLLQLAGASLLAPLASAQWPNETLLPLPNGWTAFNAELDAGDINADGRHDIVYANHSNGAVQWLENDGSETWASHPIANLGQYLNMVELLDVNRDGRIDIVASWFLTSQGGDSIAWFENPGAATTWTQHPVSVFPFAITKAMTVLDMDGDGHDDLLLSADDSLPYQNHMAYRNTGTGLEFTSYVAIHDAVTVPSSGDFDGDGDDDLAFVRYTFPFPSWRQNTSMPGIVAWGSGSAAPACHRVTAMDLDQDGDDDMLCQVPSSGGSSYSGLQWSESVGGVMSSLQGNATLPAGGIGTHTLEVADLDLDGDPDLLFLFAAGGLPTVAFMENLGGGMFGPVSQVTPTSTTAVPRGKVFGDFDGDGDIDVVVAWGDTTATDSIMLLKNPRVFGSDLVCTSQPNSTGVAATLHVTGAETVAVNRTTLVCEALPSGTFCMFLSATAQIPGVMPPGSNGTVCLGGAIGRYDGPGQLQMARANGRAVLPLDLTEVPQPNGTVSVLPGQTFYFQTWFRDTVQGQATSNFSSAQSVTFR